MEDPWLKHKEKPIHNLVISGGSIGGLIVAGVWRAMEEYGRHSDIVNIAGCSVGSIFALLISLGYNAYELKTVCKNFRYKDYASLNILCMFEKLGLEDGDNIMRLLKTLTTLKIGSVCEGDKLTFRQLYNITGRRLHVNAYCIEDDCGAYFTVDNTPDMPVLLAIRMSIAIPLVLTAVRHNGKTYVDGGLDNVFPISIFPAENTLGIRIINRESVFTEAASTEVSYDFSDFVLALLKNLYKRLWTGIIGLEEYRVIEVHTGVSSLSLDINRQDRNRLIDKGYEAASAKLKR